MPEVSAAGSSTGMGDVDAIAAMIPCFATSRPSHGRRGADAASRSCGASRPLSMADRRPEDGCTRLD